jgi:transposase-like protein
VQHLVRHGKRISEQELGRSGRTARRFAADLAAAGKTKEAFAGYVIWWSPSRQVVASDILRISADSIVASPTRASATATTLSWNLYHFVPYSGIARVNLGFFHDPPLDPNYLMT